MPQHHVRAAGSSPRVRGNHRTNSRTRPCRGIIPACAGEPRARVRSCPSGRDHPRVCGGTQKTAKFGMGTAGSSPRVRGNRRRRRHRALRVGIIPACAGEPASSLAALSAKRDHPRVCGGTLHMQTSPILVGGSSPRVRGNRQGGGGERDRIGIIPACAGEPRPTLSRSGSARDHPRVCGGTTPEASTVIRVVGSSPRVRGNHRCYTCLACGQRIIPACAGEP